jgi:choline dehydrogenase-like flavoprotein
MKLPTLFAASLLSLATASPVKQEKRQLTGLLASLAGILGANQTFDYIVLGGGTAGLTIAKRLAEDPSVTVAVIEAGLVYQVTDPVLEQTPAGDVTFVGLCPIVQIIKQAMADDYTGTSESLPTVDWGFFTPADPASNNIKRSYARGKCLGGRCVVLTGSYQFILTFIVLQEIS